GFTVLAIPNFFQAGQRRTSRASRLMMFRATAPPREEPTITWGWCLSNSSWAILMASANSSSGSFGLMTSWPCWARKVGFTPPGTDCQPWRKRIFMMLLYSLASLIERYRLTPIECSLIHDQFAWGHEAGGRRERW